MVEAEVPTAWWKTALGTAVGVAGAIVGATWSPWWQLSLFLLLAALVFVWLLLRNPELWLRRATRSCLGVAIGSAALPDLTAWVDLPGLGAVLEFGPWASVGFLVAAFGFAVLDGRRSKPPPPPTSGPVSAKTQSGHAVAVGNVTAENVNIQISGGGDKATASFRQEILAAAAREASTDRFTVAVLDLDNDTLGRDAKTLLLDELSDRTETDSGEGSVQLLDIRTGIGASDIPADTAQAGSAGHRMIASALQRSTVDAAIWGSVIHSGDKRRYRIHWSIASQPFKEGRYETEHFAFPQLLLEDLKDMLWALTTLHTMSLQPESATPSPQQRNLISSIEKLVNARSFQEDWPSEDRVRMRLLLISPYLLMGLHTRDTRLLKLCIQQSEIALSENDFSSKDLREFLPTLRVKYGAALTEIARNNSDLNLYNRAIEQFDDVINNHPEDSASKARGSALHNRGNAYSDLAEDTLDRNMLARGIASYLEALKTRTRQREPENWAMSQAALAMTVKTAGEWLNEPPLIRTATESLVEVQSFYKETDNVFDYARTTKQVADSTRCLSNMTGDFGSLGQIPGLLRRARSGRLRKEAPYLWAQLTWEQGVAQASVAEQRQDTQEIRNAISIIEESLSIWTKAEHPDQWAMAQNDIAVALLNIAAISQSKSTFKQAESAVLRALEVRQTRGTPAKLAHDLITAGNILRVWGSMFQEEDKILRSVDMCRKAQVMLTGAGESTQNVILADLGMADSMRCIGELRSSRETLREAADIYNDLRQRNLDRPLRRRVLDGLMRSLMAEDENGDNLLLEVEPEHIYALRHELEEIFQHRRAV